MDMLKDIDIRLMTADDTAFAKEMTDIEKWGNTQADFERLVDLEPEGCFVAWSGGRRVGMITSIGYMKYAFLGSLIVREEVRGQGLGASLMQHAIKFRQESGADTIELDAEMRAVPLYRRMGFKDKYLSLRFARPGGPLPFSRPGRSTVRVTPDSDLRDIIQTIDRGLTFLGRERLIDHFLSEFPENVFYTDGGVHSGYAFARPIVGNRHVIGPIVASDNAPVHTLIDAIVASLGDNELHLGVPECTFKTKANLNIQSVLLDYGFVYRPPSLRMYLGERRDYEHFIAGIFSPEKG